jgi:putative ABC transport system ATP-binding protein
MLDRIPTVRRDFMSIALRDITKVYRMGDQEVQALRGVSLAVEDGELIAIMGPSGSGKSTLMNIIGCLDQPTSGSYLLDGIEVGGLDDDALADIRNHQIGFVFQSYNLLQRMPAIEQVEVPLYCQHEHHPEQRAMEAFQTVGLATGWTTSRRSCPEDSRNGSQSRAPW